MAALNTTTYTSGPLNYGRSGYNKDDADNTPKNRGRSGYNRDGTDDTTRDCRTGEEGNDPNSGRSGYN